jgi:serine/threonine protein kinase
MVMRRPNYVTINASTAIVRSDPAVSESLLRDIASRPVRLIEAAACRPVKIDFESLVVQVELTVDDRQMLVAIKQYRPRTFWKALAAVFRPAKAMENWRKADFLLSRNIATARPLLACRPHGWRSSSTSFLATEWIDSAENLHLFGWRIAAGPPNVRLCIAARCAEALGRLLGRMHASGASHRDLKAANLLVVQRGHDVIAYLVDLDGLQMGDNVEAKRQARDLARLAAGLVAHPWVTRSICRQFLRAYMREFCLEDSNWKPLWRTVALEAEKIIRRKRQRREAVL